MSAGVGVALLRVNLSGQTTTSDLNSVVDYGPVAGHVQAFVYATRTLIQSVEFSFVQGKRFDDGDLLIRAESTARVNDVLTNISLVATKIEDIISFEIRDTNTDNLLVEATGEPGRATLNLSLTRL